MAAEMEAADSGQSRSRGGAAPGGWGGAEPPVPTHLPSKPDL